MKNDPNWQQPPQKGTRTTFHSIFSVRQPHSHPMNFSQVDGQIQTAWNPIFLSVCNVNTQMKSKLNLGVRLNGERPSNKQLRVELLSNPVENHGPKVDASHFVRWMEQCHEHALNKLFYRVKVEHCIRLNSSLMQPPYFPMLSDCR